jgi:lysophospholipase L1-like esterase
MTTPRQWTTHPAFVVPVVTVLVLVLTLLLWKGGKNPSNTVNPAEARRLEASAAAKASADSQEQERNANAARAQITRPKGRRLRITFVGDSITTGTFAQKPENAFADLVTGWLQRRIPVAVSKVSSPTLTSTQALEMTIPNNQDVVVVFLGTYEFYGKTPKEFISSYPRLIDQVRKESPDSQILCVAPWLGSTDTAYLRVIQHSCSDPRIEAVVDLTSLLSDPNLRAKKGDPYRGGNVPFGGFPNDLGHVAIAKAIENMIQVVG